MPDSENSNASDENFEFSWSQVCPSAKRERAILGALLGIAVGEALGLGRQSIGRRMGLWMFGKGPLRYHFVPSMGIASIRLHASLSAGQSVLRSYQKQAVFLKQLSIRFRFYLFPSFLLVPWRITVSGMKLWFDRTESPVGIAGKETVMLPRSLLLSTALQGTSVRVDRWIESATKMTQSDPEVIEACALLAFAAQLATFTHRGFDPNKAWRMLSDEVVDEKLLTMMDRLGLMLERKMSVRKAALAMGWDHGVPDQPYPTAALSIYAWLRHPKKFRRAVEAAILIGGNTATVGAIVAGLSGIRLSLNRIPPEWLNGIASWPHGREWMELLAKRLCDWPHGAEDLHRAPALSSNAILQIVRSLLLTTVQWMHTLIKFPFRFSR